MHFQFVLPAGVLGRELPAEVGLATGATRIASEKVEYVSREDSASPPTRDRGLDLFDLGFTDFKFLVYCHARCL